MSFFKRKKEEYEVHAQEVPLSTVYRWFLYDTCIVDNINDLAEMIGLSRISEEGELKEEEDSLNRVDAIAPLYPFLDSIATVSAKSFCALHLSKLFAEDEADNDLFEQQAEAMFEMYKDMALSTLVATFSIGLHLGMINTNTVNSDVLELGDIDEQF